jgi:4-hydroxybenzoate polyprenyltransferase
VRGLLAKRLFPILQLTRLALVFTAISNSLCTLMLGTRQRIGDHASTVLNHWSWTEAGLVALVSFGLYAFGMSLNDIIDRRRDRTLAAHRPLPSGRISVTTAHILCTALALLALVAGALFCKVSEEQSWLSFVILCGTGLLITFYDAAGKYLVALGLITLGLIRFFHAIIPAPQVPLLWHPMLLMNHTTILSLVAYRWEQKRPALTKVHWWTVLGGLAFIDLLLILLEAGDLLWQGMRPAALMREFGIHPALFAPAAAALTFALLAWRVRRRRERRLAGQMLMLYGLLWLIVYDVTFAAGYVDPLAALLLLLLLPMAYGAVQMMRWWGRMVLLSQKPDFRRAED